MTTILLTGVTAAGKSHMIAALQGAGFKRVVTLTTRSPRPGEQAGVDYEFLTDNEFKAIEKSGDLAEVNEFSGAKYGTRLSDLSAPGFKAVIVDPNGHRALKALHKRLQLPYLSVFIDCNEEVQAGRFMRRVMEEVNESRHRGEFVDHAVARSAKRLAKMLSEEATWRDTARIKETPYDWVIPQYDDANAAELIQAMIQRARSAAEV